MSETCHQFSLPLPPKKGKSLLGFVPSGFDLVLFCMAVVEGDGR